MRRTTGSLVELVAIRSGPWWKLWEKRVKLPGRYVVTGESLDIGGSLRLELEDEESFVNRNTR